MNKFDMHVHSTLSDGVNSPKDILDYASRTWFKLITLTDHDIASSKDFVLNAKEKWITSFSASEISVRDYDIDKSLHFTYYAKDFNSKVKDIIQNTREKKIDMIVAQIDKLKQKGFIIDINDFYNYYLSKWKTIETLNKMCIAKYIFQNISNIDFITKIVWKNISEEEFLHLFLKEWWDYYEQYSNKIKDYEPSVEVCWALAIANKAVLSIAHPNLTFWKNGISYFKELLPKYTKFWVNAIEINSKAPKEWLGAIYEAKKQFDLVLTAWSDNHFIWYSDRKHWNIWEINQLLTIEDREKILKEFMLWFS